MISFHEYARERGWDLGEASREEREAEAIRREIQRGSYWDAQRLASANVPRKAPEPNDAEAWREYMSKIKAASEGLPRDPFTDFVAEFEKEIRAKTGLSWTHGELVPDIETDSRREADDDRLRDIIFDSFDDGSSPEETALMAIEFLRSKGYLR